MLAVAIVAVWTVLALGAALVLCGGIRLADRRAPLTDHELGLTTDRTVTDVLAAAVQPAR